MAHVTDATFFPANAQRLAAAQPAVVVPPATDGIRAIDGVWKLVDGSRAVAIHSRDPQREADRYVAGLLDSGKQPSLVVVIGLGIGYLLDALERRGWTGTVLAIEPEPGTVQPLLARRDLRSWFDSGRLRLLVGPDFIGAADCQRLFGDGATVPPVFVNPALAPLRPGPVEAARALVKRMCLEAGANAEARRTLGARYLLNTLGNLHAIATEADAASLFDAAKGVPTILVAAGPSLERALPTLRATQGAVLIVCVDTALRPLLSAGVTPDLVVAVDPSESNAHHLTDLPFCPDTYLVAEGSLDRLPVEAFRGRTFFFNVSNHQPWPWLERQGRTVGRLRAWGSVLTTAFDLTLQMGCDPIVFMGADLAYTSGQTYCRGVYFEEHWHRQADWGTPLAAQWSSAIDAQPAAMAADLAGKPVRTAPHLLAFRNWLLDQMRRERDRRFFNATNGGILHGDGVRQLAFADVAATLSGSGAVTPAIRERHQRADGQPLLAAAADLATRAAAGDATVDPVLAEWEAFAPGLSRDRLLAALQSVIEPAPTSLGPGDDAPRHALLVRDELRELWLKPLVDAVPLVPLVIPAHRLTWAPSGARVYRFRTTAARIISCVLQPSENGLTEDGRSLALTHNLDHVVPGSYSVCRDEVHFRASDDSDPRANGRTYTLFVPPCIVALESLRLDTVIQQGF